MSSALEIPPCSCTIGLFGAAVCTYNKCGRVCAKHT
uniref:Uncharacterized protein n=1 Tax=Anguilla anguilla TaxID=7936 RepID=A0A0E9SWJ1_ANGAN